MLTRLVVSSSLSSSSRRSIIVAAASASSASVSRFEAFVSSSSSSPTTATTVAATAACSNKNFSTVGNVATSNTAKDAAALGCYDTADFCIDETSSVYDAVQRFCAYNIGCLVTTDAQGAVTGVISERDYISKIDLLDRNPKETQIKEIATPLAQLITAKPTESVEVCMAKMLEHEIRHLPLMSSCSSGSDGSNAELLGMVSIKDLVRTTVQEKEATIKVLTNFSLGKDSYSM